MKIEIGNLQQLSKKNPERRGWFIGDFIPQESLLHSEKCEIKWAYHLKGLKKNSGKELNENVRTAIVLIKGKWLTKFLKNENEIVLSTPGDYLIYTGAQHENEALENSHVIIIRWKN